LALDAWLHSRLQGEWETTKPKNTEERTIAPVDEKSLRVWRGYLRHHKGEMHAFEMRFTKAYPLEPPEFEWLTPISHPNIEPPKPQGLGRVCLDWLTNPREWSPDTSVNAIIEGALYVLNNPNPSDPMMHRSCLREAIRMLEEDISKHSDAEPNLPKVRMLLASAKQSIERPSVSTSDEMAYKLIKEAALLLGYKQKGARA